jgi:hypothetical protein
VLRDHQLVVQGDLFTHGEFVRVDARRQEGQDPAAGSAFGPAQAPARIGPQSLSVSRP